MFTGLIEEIGEVVGIDQGADAARLTVRGPLAVSDATHGASISVSGVCLTVIDSGPDWFTADVMSQTLAMSALGQLRAGSPVNLERAAQVGDRLGGHIVQGHVDGVGIVRSVERRGDAWLIDVALPEGFDALLVPHGSVTVDGVSLTVNALPAPGVVQLSIIEYTHRHTTLGLRRTGDAVHVEADMIGKHVQRLLAPYLASLSRV